MNDEAKRKVVNAGARYLVNPVMRRVGGHVPGWILLEHTGRRTGVRRRTPLAGTRRGDTIWIVAEHGDHADWVRNVRATPRVRVRTGGRWWRGTARPVPEDDPVARSRDLNLVARLGLRLVGTDLLSVRVDLEKDEEGRPGPGAGPVAGIVAGLVSGLPSTLDAIARGGLVDLYRAPGAQVLPRRGPVAQMAATLPVHLAISAGWGTVLAAVLPRRATVAWGIVAGVGIYALDLGVIGRRLPIVRDLRALPQALDHVMFGAAAAALIRWQRAGASLRSAPGVGTGAGAAP